jgi:DNA-binding LacI/PurR family transcriptional regulator
VARARGRVTIEDVAAAAGVSRQTVSRAMNDMAEINAATRERVLAVARELHYRPSRFGRGLAGARQHTLGLRLHDLMNPYFPELAAAVARTAAERGWTVVLSDEQSATEPAADLRALVRQADVAVGYLDVGDPRVTDTLHGLPFVQIDRPPSSPFGGVEFALDGAMDDAVAHLGSRGVRRPAVVAVDPASGRMAQFAERLTAAGLPVVAQAAIDGDPIAAGVAAVQELLSSHPDVDAVLAFNDLMACGVMKGLHAAGRDIPVDVRVVGVDGLTLGTVVTPALTTLAIDMRAVARDAVDLAIGIIEGTEEPRAVRRVEHELVVRDST